jgi:hypothetical protein
MNNLELLMVYAVSCTVAYMAMRYAMKVENDDEPGGLHLFGTFFPLINLIIIGIAIYYLFTQPLRSGSGQTLLMKFYGRK